MEILKNNKNFSEESALVIGIFEDQNEVKISENIDQEINKLITNNLVKKDLGNVNKIYTFGKIENEIIFLIGLGKKSEFSIEKLEKAASQINKNLYEKLVVFVESFIGNLDDKEVVKKLLLTIDYYDYAYDECKSKKEEKTLEVSFISNKNYDKIIEEYYNVANAISNTRDLVNKPYNYLDANGLAEYAKALVKSFEKRNRRFRNGCFFRSKQRINIWT